MSTKIEDVVVYVKDEEELQKISDVVEGCMFPEMVYDERYDRVAFSPAFQQWVFTDEKAYVINEDMSVDSFIHSFPLWYVNRDNLAKVWGYLNGNKMRLENLDDIPIRPDDEKLFGGVSTGTLEVQIDKFLNELIDKLSLEDDVLVMSIETSGYDSPRGRYQFVLHLDTPNKVEYFHSNGNTRLVAVVNAVALYLDHCKKGQFGGRSIPSEHCAYEVSDKEV
jgi:hypothetical protein